MEGKVNRKSLSEQIAVIKSANRLGLMTHVVMGYPTLAETKERVLRMAAAGVDMIELQIPFSDPLADGPAITLANQQALANGTTVADCLALAADLTKAVAIPLQFIGYYNTVFRYGVDEFVRRSASSGIAGFTFPDLPFAEWSYEPFSALAAAVNVPMIQLISPATPADQLQRIAATADTMVYCVARFGVTGATPVDRKRLLAYLQNVRNHVTLPLAVGFGLKQAADLTALRGLAEIAVIGSALLQLTPTELSSFLKKLCASR